MSLSGPENGFERLRRSIPTRGRVGTDDRVPGQERGSDMRMTTGSARDATGTRTDRIFTVQEAFVTIGRPTARLIELASVTGLDDATVGRILRSGIRKGQFVQYGRGVYGLGLGAAEIGFQAMVYAHQGGTSHAELEELRRSTDQGLVLLYMKTPFGLGRQCIDMAVGDSDLVELGTPRAVLSVTRSLRVGAAGRAILANLPDALQEAVLSEPTPRKAGPGAYRDNDALRATLVDVRDCGYALGHQESMTGRNSVAAPISWDDSVMGSIVVLKPMDVMPRAPMHYIEATMKTATLLSRVGGDA